MSMILANELIDRVKNLHYGTEQRLDMTYVWRGGHRDIQLRALHYEKLCCTARRVWLELGDKRELIIKDNAIYIGPLQES